MIDIFERQESYLTENRMGEDQNGQRGGERTVKAFKNLLLLQLSTYKDSARKFSGFAM